MAKTKKSASKDIKPAMSMAGWQFKKWALGNKKSLKEILKIGVPMLVAYLSGLAPWAQILLVAVGKLALDSFEFWLKEIELSQKE